MAELRPTVVVHGGALSDPKDRDGPERACQAGLAELRAGRGPLEAAVAACRWMEDDGRFNAGRGSIPRVDGATIEMDAACMAGDGRYGGVVCLEGVRNPVLVARRVLDTPHIALAAAGAHAFAAGAGLAQPVEPSRHALERAAQLREQLEREGRMDPGWSRDALLRAWNYPRPLPPVRESDTVGAVASDGKAFAAAASTGGLSVSLRGRVSDVGMVGGGIYAGPKGAVAVTGHGEYLAGRLVSHHAYLEVARGRPCAEAVREVVEAAGPAIPVGVVALGFGGPVALTNRRMPWAAASL